MTLSLEDKIELIELVGRYGDALDDENWDALDDIFTADATFAIPVLNASMTGIEDIKKFMDQSGDLHPAAHLMTNVYSLETANGVELRSRVILPRTQTQEDGSATITHGSYYDTVVKTDSGWRICKREFRTKRRDRRK